MSRVKSMSSAVEPVTAVSTPRIPPSVAGTSSSRRSSTVFRLAGSSPPPLRGSSSDGAAEYAVDDRRPEAGVLRIGPQVREERNAAAVDVCAEQLEHGAEHGHGTGNGARDDEDRAGRDAVEDLRADQEHAGHRDRYG